MHEVEQVIEPATGIGRRPTMKFGLHLRYPLARPCGRTSRSAGIHRRLFRSCSVLISSNRCRPSPCGRLSRPRSTTATPPHPSRSADDGPSPASTLDAQQQGKPKVVPVFTVVRSSKEEPDSAPAASPRVRRRPSPAASRSRASPLPEVPHHRHRWKGRAAPGPHPPDSSR
jgi:hypothetical protein